jgi:hypothetical protein
MKTGPSNRYPALRERRGHRRTTEARWRSPLGAPIESRTALPPDGQIVPPPPEVK